MPPIRRSILFTPGDSLQKISKTLQFDADSVILDLEDAVTLNRKAEARQIVNQALTTLTFGQRERLIRINGPGTAHFRPDLEETVVCRPDGYVISKVEEPDHIQHVSEFLDEVEQKQGWVRGAVRLLALIETPLGVMNLADIAAVQGRLDALLFGGEDFTRSVGAKRSQERWELFYARSAIVTAAAAYNLQAIDTVFVSLHDDVALEEESRWARNLGFTGKMAIHPRQLEIINRVFSPSPEEISYAQELIAAYAAHQEVGIGVFELNGEMVDLPMIRSAERTLKQARRVGFLLE
jgi:citrate lyase beta subunit